ncbi:MAG: formylglycine-generating enzyme family protein [Acetobacteraceae bacterium]
MRFALVLAAVVLGGLGFSQADAQTQKAAGSLFKDCSQCPDMVVISPGSFIMGEDGRTREMPRHTVTVGYSFAVSRFDVTFDEWDACVADGGCGMYRPADAGWGRGRRPVVNVSWDDIQSYLAWISKKTGKRYRLPSEAEWEYVARAGTTTAFWWGNDVGNGNANCDHCGSAWDDKQTSPVASFRPNAFGVYDTAGNVTQWVEDRWNANYNGAPQDGSAWEAGDPLRRVMRSGSWYNGPAAQHSAFRNGDSPRVRNVKIGFRIAVTM